MRFTFQSSWLCFVLYLCTLCLSLVLNFSVFQLIIIVVSNWYLYCFSIICLKTKTASLALRKIVNLFVHILNKKKYLSWVRAAAILGGDLLEVWGWRNFLDLTNLSGQGEILYMHLQLHETTFFFYSIHETTLLLHSDDNIDV